MGFQKSLQNFKQIRKTIKNYSKTQKTDIHQPNSYFSTGTKRRTTPPTRTDISSPSDSSCSSTDNDDSSSSDSETPRNPRTNAKPSIPKHKYSKRTKSEIDRMRADFPNLNHHPDDTFRTLSWTELMRLDSKLEANGKSSKKLTEKLAKNLEKMKNNPKTFPESKDNRTDILHEARFIGGHSCNNDDIWLKARSLIGLTGLEPISRYDAENVGLNSNINSHIWANLHNPGSKEISIRMLSPNGLKESRNYADKNNTPSKKDFENFNDLRQAMATLRTANHFIHPWNFAYVTLEYFLITVQYGEKEIGSTQIKLNFVSDFIDDIISHNAEAWDDAKPHLNFNGISNRWISETMLKLPKNTNKQQYEKSAAASANYRKNIMSQPLKPGNLRIFTPPGVCRRYNLKICPNQTDSTCTAPWDSSKTLNHQCAHKNNADKKFCLQNHPYLDHK